MYRKKTRIMFITAC